MGLYIFDDFVVVIYNVLENGYVIVVGGGNIFYFLYFLYCFVLMVLLKYVICNGVFYVGWSVGLNICG